MQSNYLNVTYDNNMYAIKFVSKVEQMIGHLFL